ncbi:MAG: hypothetical protein ACLTSC_14050 [Mediterraneibacter faecis]
MAVALFTQLYYNKLSEDKEALRLFMKGMDMPLTLQGAWNRADAEES